LADAFGFALVGARSFAPLKKTGLEDDSIEV
jgi:hypothetical protein